MKQELPFAIALLAIGFLLWVTKSASTSDAIAAGEETRKPAVKISNDGQIRAKLKASSTAIQGDPQAAEILNQLAIQLRDGPPRQGSLTVKSRIFNKSMQIKGRFWQLGQSSLKSRIELSRFGSPFQNNSSVRRAVLLPTYSNRSGSKTLFLRFVFAEGFDSDNQRALDANRIGRPTVFFSGCIVQIQNLSFGPGPKHVGTGWNVEP